MRSFTLAVLAAFVLFSPGCTSTPSSPYASPSVEPTAPPDAAATSQVRWQTFKAPNDAFTVEVPSPMTEMKDAKGHRFQTPRVTGHVVYDVSYIDIDPGDAGVDRARLVRDFTEGIIVGNKVEYRQAGLFKGQYPSEMLRLTTPKKETIQAQVFAGQKRVWVMEVIIPVTYKDIKMVPSHRFMLSMKPDDTPPAPGASPAASPALAPSGSPR